MSPPSEAPTPGVYVEIAAPSPSSSILDALKEMVTETRGDFDEEEEPSTYEFRTRFWEQYRETFVHSLELEPLALCGHLYQVDENGERVDGLGDRRIAVEIDLATNRIATKSDIVLNPEDDLHVRCTTPTGDLDHDLQAKPFPSPATISGISKPGSLYNTHIQVRATEGEDGEDTAETLEEVESFESGWFAIGRFDIEIEQGIYKETTEGYIEVVAQVVCFPKAVE